jgi:hypothetical protein
MMLNHTRSNALAFIAMAAENDAESQAATPFHSSP